MNAPRLPAGSAPAMRRLADFLAESGSPLMPAEAVNEAIDQWIATNRSRLSGEFPVPTRGYRWKSLFLPEGTRLRMHFGGRSYDATVEGDDLVFEGQRVSPRQMTLAVSGQGYNAWRALWVLLPGKIRWQPASVLRRAAAQQETRRVSPLEALNAAAACMSETVKTAMALVDHAKAQAQPSYDRRIVRRRRASDSLDDACMDD